jgi:hypothetical protein
MVMLVSRIRSIPVYASILINALENKAWLRQRASKSMYKLNIDPSELCVVQRRILVSFRQVSEVHAKQKVVSLQEARQKVHIRQRLDKCFHIIISEQVCEFIVFSSYKKRHKDACTLGMEGGIVRRGGNVPVQNVPCHAGVQASDAFRFRDGAPK